jgi:hypothetical protein
VPADLPISGPGAGERFITRIGAEMGVWPSRQKTLEHNLLNDDLSAGAID